LMNWASLILTVPVVLYCAWPVWGGSWRNLRHGRVSMDVPVALGIIAAFLPSVHATWTAQGEVYFDSVTMFVAFLLTARYLELCARQSVTVDASHKVIETARQSITKRADVTAFWFVAIQLFLAFLVAGVWYLYIAPDRTLPVMIAMLVMSCPCAMAMSVPTAVAAAHAALVKRPASTPSDLSRLALSTDRVARQNLYGSVAWHLLMTLLAAIGLVAPWLAAVTMLLSSLAVALNSWRVFRRHTRADPLAWNNVVA
jgi:cation transport ATPase